MMTKASSLLFALAALSVTSVMAAPAHRSGRAPVHYARDDIPVVQSAIAGTALAATTPTTTASPSTTASASATSSPSTTASASATSSPSTTASASTTSSPSTTAVIWDEHPAGGHPEHWDDRFCHMPPPPHLPHYPPHHHNIVPNERIGITIPSSTPPPAPPAPPASSTPASPAPLGIAIPDGGSLSASHKEANNASLSTASSEEDNINIQN